MATGGKAGSSAPRWGMAENKDQTLCLVCVGRDGPNQPFANQRCGKKRKRRDEEEAEEEQKQDGNKQATGGNGINGDETVRKQASSSPSIGGAHGHHALEMLVFSRLHAWHPAKIRTKGTQARHHTNRVLYHVV